MSHWSCEGGVCRLVEDELEGENGEAAGEGASAAAAPSTAPLKIGVLVSGSGTNLQAIIDRIANGSLNAGVALVVSSRPGVRGIERAQAAGLPVLVMEKSEYAADAEAADRKIATALKDAGCEYVIMAGYMRMVRKPLLEAYPGRIVNLHPALLPSFKGAHAIQDAFDYGVKVTGVTVHFADDKYDCGPIIAQRALTVEEGWDVDELEAHIHAIEHELYPEVIGWLAAGRVHLRDNGRVDIDPA